jgi:hypothetical protein
MLADLGDYTDSLTRISRRLATKAGEKCGLRVVWRTCSFLLPKSAGGDRNQSASFMPMSSNIFVSTLELRSQHDIKNAGTQPKAFSAVGEFGMWRACHVIAFAQGLCRMG